MFCFLQRTINLESIMDEECGLKLCGIYIYFCELKQENLKCLVNLINLAKVCSMFNKILNQEKDRIFWYLKMMKTHEMITKFCLISNVYHGYHVFHDIMSVLATNRSGKHERIYTRRIHGENVEINEIDKIEFKPTVYLKYGNIEITSNNSYYSLTLLSLKPDTLTEKMKGDKHRPTPWILDYWGDRMHLFVI